jgi:hypothetical protein
VAGALRATKDRFEASGRRMVHRNVAPHCGTCGWRGTGGGSMDHMSLVVKEWSMRILVLTRTHGGVGWIRWRPEAPGDGEVLGHSVGRWSELESVVSAIEVLEVATSGRFRSLRCLPPVRSSRRRIGRCQLHRGVCLWGWLHGARLAAPVALRRRTSGVMMSPEDGSASGSMQQQAAVERCSISMNRAE